MPSDSVRLDILAMPEKNSDCFSAGDGQFRTTHWSAIVQAGNVASVEATAALNELCQVYWHPLYAYACHQGWPAQEAEDLTQAFFARLLEKNAIALAEPEKGRFRTFLLTLFKRFLVNEWHRRHTQKRGGFQPAVSLDAGLSESRAGPEPVHRESPDFQFDQQWATTLLDAVMTRLQREYVQTGRGALFGQLEARLVHEEAALPYAEIGARLNLTEGAVKMAMQRLRTRYQAILREEIGKTVAAPEEIEAEIRDLFAAFRR
jgi:RNA polymerase sigma factor (sigma-70 family)